MNPIFSAPEEHAARVSAIAETLRDLAHTGEPVHIDKGGVHHVVPLPGDPRFRTRKVDVSSLGHILHLDPTARVCVAEPGVTFASLLDATLPLGLIPAVVPELEGITLGGAVAGCSVESMSWRYGGFHDNCLEYEIITGDGRVITCSPENDPEAFHAIHGSYGTLGILSRLTFRLLPAQPFVKMEYKKFSCFKDFDAEMRLRIKEGDVDFMDGIVHAGDELVLCLGRFVAEADKVSTYRWLDIYYQSTRRLKEDWLTTREYCFRYDTECHWLTATVPPLEWKLVRFLVGKLFLGSTNLIRWSGRLGPILGMKKRPDVVVDVFIPARNFGEFFQWYQEEYRFYPLWTVPYRIPTMYPWIDPAYALTMGDELFIDCAVYGKPNSDPSVDHSEVLERKTHALSGIKTLISRNHYSEAEFWTVYHQEGYQKIKARLDPSRRFPGIFEKFSRVG